MIHGFGDDLAFAARRLLAAPLFTMFAILSLALGVGVTTCVYSLVAQTFWRETPVHEPDGLLFVSAPGASSVVPARLSHADYADLLPAQTSFETIAASATIRVALTSSVSTDLVSAEAVDGSYFQMLGIAPVLGRHILPTDADARIVVLSHSLWRSRFRADPSVIGQTVRISGEPFEVIGIAAASFDGLRGSYIGTSLWLPLSAADLISREAIDTPISGSDQPLTVVGRLAAAVSESAAASEVGAIGARLDAQRPHRSRFAGREVLPRRWTLRSLADINAQSQALSNRFGFVLVGLVALVLVVACTNLANLVLARGTTRLQELAVRSALGASRWRLVRAQLVETGLLAAAGGLGSWLVAQGLRVALDVELPLGPRQMLRLQPAFDAPVVVASLVAVLLSLVVFGLEPALMLTRRRDVRNDLAAGSGSAAPPRSRRQRTLLRWQVAISAGFFIIATLFVRHTIEELRHDIGFDIDRLAVAVVSVDVQGWDEARVRRVVDRALEEARGEPGVAGVTVSTGMPFGIPNVLSISVRLPNSPGRPIPAVAAVPSFFRTIGVPLVHGRGFENRDHAGAAPVVVLSARTARRVFGTANAVGRQIEMTVRGAAGQRALTATVVGVARDTDTGFLIGREDDLAYLPFSQHFGPRVVLTARATGDTARAVLALRSAIRRADPDLAIDFSGTGRAVLAGPYVFLRAAGVGALALGALTLVLAMVGLFGIQTHIVSHRTREIGLRMAFGASRGNVQRMVLKDGYSPVFQGLALGLFIGLTGRTLVRTFLDVNVNVVDPWMLFVVPVPLLLAAFFACLLPAYRASRVDPNVALRQL